MRSDDHGPHPDPLPAPDEAPRPRLVQIVRRRRVEVPVLFPDPVLPSPAELIGYKAAARQAPLALLAEYLAERGHRRVMEAEIVREELRRARRGQWFALIVVNTGMLLGVALVISGHEWAGTALMGGNLLAMAALFLRVQRGDEAKPPDERTIDGRG